MHRWTRRLPARQRWTALAGAVALAVLSLPLPPPAAAADGSKPAFSEGRLWRIAKRGVGDSFAFGTIHLADPRVAAIPQPAADALADSRTLAMELPPVEIVDTQVLELEQLEDGRRLEPLLGAEAFAELQGELLIRGTPERVIARLKPWAALMKLTWGGPPGAARSLDENLFTAARVRRMQLLSLESIEEQIAAFDTIPLDSQVALLKHALARRGDTAAMTEPTIAAWLAGDLGALARVTERIGDRYPVMSAHYAQLTKHIIVDRTVLMHHRLFLPLRGGRVFVAVGALHLYGDQGLLAMLRRDGYRVTRVW